MTIIVACDENNAIGINGVMPWHIREDMLFFKAKTTGNIVVMGRKTWDGLPIKPLKNRDNYVISSNKDFCPEGAKVIHNIDDIKSLETKDKKVFITGGGNVYKQTIEMCDEIFLTRVFKCFENTDTFFPNIDKDRWILTYESEKKTDEKNGLSYCFQTYKRKK